MADQGTKAREATMAQNGQTKTTAATTVAPKVAAPAAAAAKVAEVKKMDLNKENLEKMIAKDMGLRGMALEAGVKPHEIRKALKTFGLKTKSMREGTGKVSSMTQHKIIGAIENGAGTVEKVMEKTGMDKDTVKGVVRKLKREGAIVDAFVIAPTNVAAESGDEAMPAV